MAGAALRVQGVGWARSLAGLPLARVDTACSVVAGPRGLGDVGRGRACYGLLVRRGRDGGCQCAGGGVGWWTAPGYTLDGGEVAGGACVWPWVSCGCGLGCAGAGPSDPIEGCWGISLRLGLGLGPGRGGGESV